MKSRWVICLGLVAAVGLTTAAGATVRELLMREAGLDPGLLAANPSVRLIGMGGLDLCVADEGNELNLHDFGGNIAGLLEDGDGWQIESWLGNYVQTTDRRFDLEQRYGLGGALAVYRAPGQALGARVNWSFFQTGDQKSDWNKTRGPLVEALVNRRIGPVTLGLLLGQAREKESRFGEEFFAIMHDSDQWQGQVGVRAELLGLIWGAAWDFTSGEVSGYSRDPSRFHADAYTWTRPVDRYSFCLLLRPGGRLEGGLRGSWLDREGSEEVVISWSDRMPLNPSQSNYTIEAVTLWEAESDAQIASELRYQLRAGTILGLRAAYRSWDWEVEEGGNFKGSIRAGNWEESGLSFVAGVSQRMLASRLLIGLEGEAAFGKAKTIEREVEEDADWRRLEAGVGLEYFASRQVALRAGLRVGSEDLNLDAPLTLFLKQGVTAGISWVPAGGLAQLHGAIQYWRHDPEDDAAVRVEKHDEVSYLLGLRLLP